MRRRTLPTAGLNVAHSPRRSGAWLAWWLCMAPSVATAQAICSAPHSSPTLAGGGTLETLPAGAGWVMVSGLQQSSTRSFAASGDRQPLLANGRFRSSSVYLSGALGIRPGIDIWAQVPVHVMRYADDGGSRDRTGVGDVRMALRVSPDVIGRRAPVALRVGLKQPGSDFPVDATIIPLTEGQRDVDVSVETGRAIGAQHVLGWVGHRWRSENRRAARQPGNEWFAHAAAGRTLRDGTRLELGVDALVGAAPRQLGFPLEASRRRLLQLSPTVGRAIGPGTLEFTATLPLLGRNLPAGSGLSGGYRFSWGRPAAVDDFATVP